MSKARVCKTYKATVRTADYSRSGLVYPVSYNKDRSGQVNVNRLEVLSTTLCP